MRASEGAFGGHPSSKILDTPLKLIDSLEFLF